MIGPWGCARRAAASSPAWAEPRAGSPSRRCASGPPLLAQPRPSWRSVSPTSGATSSSSTTPGTAARPCYEHWDYLERGRPSTSPRRYVPQLGPYDVRAAAVIEQHARWIADAGVGGVALSWWGRGSFIGPGHPADHGRDARARPQGHVRARAVRHDRGRRFADDILYLLREHGEKRASTPSCSLPTRTAAGAGVQGLPLHPARRAGSIATASSGRSSDYTPDHVWREQTDGCERRCGRSSTTSRCWPIPSSSRARPPPASTGSGSTTTTSRRRTTLGYAEGASRAGLLFSFNVNPGYDQIEPRPPLRGLLRGPATFAPPGVEPADWTLAAERERAAVLSTARIAASSRPRWPCRRTAPDQRPARVLPRLHQLLQRVARGPRLRAHEGRGRAHSRGARAGVSKPRPGRLPPAGAAGVPPAAAAPRGGSLTAAAPVHSWIPDR